MLQPTLFHLHFNTPDIVGAADRLARAGVRLQRRFGSVRGDSIALAPDDRTPDNFRLKLQVHQYGAVNITLAPGQQPRFDHVGLHVADIEDICSRAESHGWSVRSNERRTFVMTPWGFRVEIHPATADVVAELGEPTVAHLENVALVLSGATTARESLEEVFGPLSELQIERGEGPWINSFTVAQEQSASTVAVQTLLSDRT